MAKTDTKGAAKGGAKAGAKGGQSQSRPAAATGGDKKRVAGPTDHEPKAMEQKPRLLTYYENTVRAKVAKDYGLANPNQVPRLQKIVLNVGMGEGAKNPKLIDYVVEELGIISGQKPVVTRAK